MQRALRYSLTALLLLPALLGAVTGAGDNLDQQLAQVLAQHQFTGRIEATLEPRLGRKLNPQLAEIGRLLWFDTITGLNDDNACAGCHSPTAGFGDTQSIAIGVENNGIVGPNRTGPRNQRRSPTVINAAFYPHLMWDSRFHALSNDPFDNRLGFLFPQPEQRSLSYLPHLLTAQAFIPPTERVEMAGMNVPGDNFDLRRAVAQRLNANPTYRNLFGRVFPHIQAGAPITYDHLARAIAEFQFTLTFANAPIDRFARGEREALTVAQKKGALLFFEKAGCVMCHAVSGPSNEMFSDFQNHNIGVPQIAPFRTNVTFDGPWKSEDFGLERVTLNWIHRYWFRTSPLRNVAVQPTFFHNGAFTRLDDAIRHHLDVYRSVAHYTYPADLDADLRAPMAPTEPLLKRIDSLLLRPISLTGEELDQLVAFVRDGLLDPRAKPENLRRLIPASVPSGRPIFRFE
jgi:cytochrome c peroxidase